MTAPGPSIGGQTVTRLRAPLVVDVRYGGEHRDWPNAARLDIRGVSVQPHAPTAEVDAGREYAETFARLFAPAGTDLVASDRVIVGGALTWELDGDAELWCDETGRPDHVEAILKRRTG